MAAKSTAGGEESSLEGLAARVPEAFFLSMLGLGTGGVMRVGGTCSALLAAVEGGGATEVRQRERGREKQRQRQRQRHRLVDG